MRNLLSLLIAGLLTFAPAASATGYLINIEIGGPTFAFGSNVFGGSGDTLDVGVGNSQCSDEADVVDVGIANREGMGSWECGDRCEHNHGEDPITPVLGQGILQPEADETPARCSDESDTVDVGVLNNEGGMGKFYCDETGCYEGQYTGDEKDATDVGVLNNEMGDDDDGNDAGVLNCETNDRRDSTDIGILNREWDDRWDTFDLSILNTEWPEGGDANGLAVGGIGIAFEVACGAQIRLPVGPQTGILSSLP